MDEVHVATPPASEPDAVPSIAPEAVIPAPAQTPPLPAPPPYTFDSCKIHLRLMWMPKEDDNPAGRRIWIVAREEEGDFLMREVREEELGPLPPLVMEMLDQLRQEMPQRAQQAGNRPALNQSRTVPPPSRPPVVSKKKKHPTPTSAAVSPAATPGPVAAATLTGQPPLKKVKSKTTSKSAETAKWVQQAMFADSSTTNEGVNNGTDRDNLPISPKDGNRQD